MSTSIGPFMNSPGFGGKAGSGGGAIILDNLEGLVSSVCFELDATTPASVADAARWKNLVTSPADGALQTDYDFYRGNSVTIDGVNPTLNSGGTAAGYWSFAGGQIFTLENTNPPLFDNMHKSPSNKTDWWMCFAFDKADLTWTAQTLFTTLADPITRTNGGIIFVANTQEELRVAVNNGTVSALYNPDPPDGRQGANLFIYTYSHATQTIDAYIHSATRTDQQTLQYFAAANSPDSPNATIAGYPNLAQSFDAETRLYHVSGGNSYIDNKEVARIVANLEARHSRDYTP